MRNRRGAPSPSVEYARAVAGRPARRQTKSMPTAAAKRSTRQALLWEARLSRPRISNAELYAFRDWLADETNRQIWKRLIADRHRHDRFVTRREDAGFSVVDLDAAPAATVEGEILTGLSGFDAQAAARRLNQAELDQRRALQHRLPSGQRPH